MAKVSEEQIINNLAIAENEVAGIVESYGFAENPDVLNRADLPCMMHYIPEVRSDLFAHHNVHKNIFKVTSILFVESREGRGGRLKYLENEAMVYMLKLRKKYQESGTIDRLLSLGLNRAYTFTMRYGVGGTLLQHNAKDYIGIVIEFEFSEVN